MRLAAAVVLLCSFVGITLAQLPPGTPCAVPCFVKNAVLSPCGPLNTTCLCTDPVFSKSVEGCVLDSCIVEDALIVQNVTNNACGVPVRNVVAQYSIISQTLTVLVYVFVGVRIVYKRFLTSLGLGADDWVMIVVAIFCVPSTVLNAKLAEYGIGRDVWALTPSDITNFGIALWLITLFYYVLISLLKISILLFYLRIFPSQGFRRVTWATIAVVSLYALAFLLAHILQCQPVSFNWTQWNDPGGRPGTGPKQGRCIDNIAVARSNAVISIVLDVWMLLLPLYKVRELNTSLKKKIAISAMFFVGTFVTVVSIIRLVYLIRFQNSNNITYDYTAALIWSTVEIGTGAICACMPSLRLILIRLWPRIFKSIASKQSRYADQKTPGSSQPGRGGGGDHYQQGRSGGQSSDDYHHQPPRGPGGAITPSSEYLDSKKPTSHSSIASVSSTWKPRKLSSSYSSKHAGQNSSSSMFDSSFGSVSVGGGGSGLERIDSSDDDRFELQPTRRPAAGAMVMGEGPGGGRGGRGSERAGDSAASFASSAEEEEGVGARVVHSGPLGKQAL
ncbi:uncharacterized protein B0I36DRAFT_352728 [Microdochium trichocladiopsis]|uniref:CFEM domain-containing protein n=1 Tax=Microdochium trichocladiopsis TaxID=1682393 RepID=A0A9P8XX95_9PEZI|nr:uncharacterized protein B0I36DRAFT_352728 [Microdochium trichocladiopsis]KAH7024497.1 hypothetical protein B0I36DRAFT_352728 [Microdochium trichocladiopsis]